VNVAAHLPRVAGERPSAVAIRCLGKKGGSLTYRELDEDSDRIARGLATLGVSRGTRVALLVTPGPDFFSLVFALFKAGAVPVIVDPGMGIKAVGACLAESAPMAFIGVVKAHVGRLLFGWAKASVTVKIACGTRFGWGGRTLDDVRRLGEPGDPVLANTSADDMAAILFTSGSTGAPKGAVYSHGNFAAQVEMLRDMYGIEPGEVDLPTFPLFALFDPALGMTTIVPDMDFTRPGRTDPRAILDPVRDYGVTNLFANPALLRRIVDGAPAGMQLPSLRRVLSAGAPVPAAVLQKMHEMLPEGVEVHTPYGATEALPVCTIGSREILRETAAKTSKGAGFCVGRSVDPMEVRVIGINDDAIATWSEDLVVPPGTIGEVVVKGPTVTRSYWSRPGATKQAKIADGDVVRHRMGDLGYFDDEGRLWFCGRTSHRVETASGTLYSVQVEALFDEHPAVRRTALVGVPGAPGARAKRPVLCVELLDSDVLTERVEIELRAIAAVHEHTRDVTTYLLHPGFPVDARHNAKIRREVLATWAARKLA